MVKKITAGLLSAVLLVGGFVGGFIVGSNDTKNYSAYEELYKGLDKMSDDDKLAYYQGMLKAESAPTQVRYVLDKIIEDSSINNDIKNNMFALYLNHIQYYMSTYSDFIIMYESIMMNNRSEINYEKADAANHINDPVLKSLITEIYNADMMIKMPPLLDNTSFPYVVVDYDTLESRYGDIYNSATKDYIKLKVMVQNGELSASDGTYDMAKVENYIALTNDYIALYDKYPLISDIIYSYILASKMYIGTFNVSGEFRVTDDAAASYAKFLEKYPETPVASIIKELLKKYENNEVISVETAQAWNNTLDGLLGQE